MRLSLIFFFFSISLVAQTDNNALRLIQLSTTVNASVEEVYKAWTTTEGIRTFFAPGGKIDLKIGGAYEIYFAPDAEPGQKGADSMFILSYEPDKMLTFTWTATPYQPSIRGQLLYVQLMFYPAEGNKTLVHFVSGGFGQGEKWTEVYNYFQKAWGGWVLPALKYRFAVGPVDWQNPPDVSEYK